MNMLGDHRCNLLVRRAKAGGAPLSYIYPGLQPVPRTCGLGWARAPSGCKISGYLSGKMRASSASAASPLLTLKAASPELRAHFCHLGPLILFLRSDVRLFGSPFQRFWQWSDIDYR